MKPLREAMQARNRRFDKAWRLVRAIDWEHVLDETYDEPASGKPVWRTMKAVA